MEPYVITADHTGGGASKGSMLRAVTRLKSGVKVIHPIRQRR